ncbi:hypothetical protein GCM10027430_01580 [Lysobacter tyrosinilyticus]
MRGLGDDGGAAQGGGENKGAKRHELWFLKLNEGTVIRAQRELRYRRTQVQPRGARDDAKT